MNTPAKLIEWTEVLPEDHDGCPKCGSVVKDIGDLCGECSAEHVEWLKDCEDGR